MNNYEIQFNDFNAFEQSKEDEFRIDIRIQQRTKKKSITSIEGLHKIPFPKEKYKGINYKKILKSMKKNFKCNGAIITNKITGLKVIQVQGDHDNGNRIKEWLVDMELCLENQINIHGV